MRLQQLGLFVTESCNLACAYCFAANMERHFIDPQLGKRAIDFLFDETNEAKDLSLTFWGGEPLLAFDLVRDLIIYAQEKAAITDKKLHIAIPTNVTLLTEEMIDFFQERDVQISLSLDGDEAAQSLRKMHSGKSTFPVIVEKLDLIRKRYTKQLPGVRMTICPDTVGDFYHNVRFFIDRGFRSVYFAPVVEADWTDAYFALYQSGLETIVDFWAEELQAGRWLFFSLLNKAIVWRELSQHGLVSTKNRRVPCGAGQKMLAINIHGDFFPCHRFIFYDKAQRQCMLGSLDSGLIDANQINKYTELDHSRLKAADQMCNECTQAQICHSLCPALNYALCNDIHSIDGRFCRFTKLEHLAVERLISQVGDIPKFRKYVDQLLKLYSSGVLSASVMAMFQRLADANPDEIAERAASIFDQLQHNRSKYPNPTQQ